MTSNLLTDVGGGHTLRYDAAAAYLAMLRAGCPRGITSSTRSYALQTAYYVNRGQPGWPKMADHPDRSKHTFRPFSRTDMGGRALDLPAQGPREWVTRWGPSFGWYPHQVAREPWHMEFRPAMPAFPVSNPSPAPGGLPTAPGGTLPPPLTPEDTMTPAQEQMLRDLHLKVDGLAALTGQVKTETGRGDPRVVLFQYDLLGVLVWGVGWPLRGYALAPSPAIWRKFLLGIGWDGHLTPDGSGFTEAVQTFSQWTGIPDADDVVVDPSFFGPQFRWDAMPDVEGLAWPATT